ncbi:hypothetical protein GCG54_00010999 [Colletotrichum gloeosporioides]|uniref:RING finger domain-containing protein n=1 Tax=Colletotrichum gloeosporioides TaxID=474922 RepID=A0A8H4CRN0_COLGL|nr:uncharacterized protein GCG54_00010999 [Colletotrichum gloeosporioides]KAF3808808.1 hypothetical protein GCG54_00010999 [Colletotrichum gloeosporioides]
MAMRQPDPEIDDVPPPPYSETDIYSTAGRSSNTNNTNASTSPRIPSDDAASRVSSHASSHSEVIYTPPLTPRTNTTQPHSRQDSSLSSANASIVNHPASSTTAAYSEFSATYFDSRPPPPSLSPREQLVHTIAVTPTTTPDDVPYAPTWVARDVTQQDWATFINVLIPHHAAARNEAVINRKLQAEEEALAAAAAAAATPSGDSVSGQSTGNNSSNSSHHASAQLEQIRSDPETDPGAAAVGVGLRREDAEGIVAQWNEGFFGPRGMLVRLSPEVEELRMPGAWDQSFDRNVDSPASAGPGGPMPFSAHAHQGPVPQQPAPSGSRSWNFAGIRLSEDGISIGDRFIADSNGIRLGSFIADERGIRFGNNPNTATPRGQPYVGQQWHPATAQPPIFPPGPFPQGPHAPPPGPPPDHPLFQAHRGGAHTRGRGRPPGRYPANQHRSPSSDSSSSASSTSSSDSASSVGSLPDYDDLYPAQLPIYKQRVADWLAHPDQPVTRAEVAQLRSEIRSARSSAREQASSSAAGTPPAAVDERALKAEIKALTQEWRKLKRQQRGARREKRRERRAKRREEKRERREQRREERRSRREGRRSGGGGRGQHHHQHHHHAHQQQHQSPTWGAPPPFPPPGVHVHVPPVHVPPVHIPPVHIPPVHIPPVPPVPPINPQPPMTHTPPAPNMWGVPNGPHQYGGGFHPWAGGFGRGWDSRGRGRGEAFNGGFPGAWPAAAERGGGVEPASPSTPQPPSSQSLFDAVKDMETDLAQKVEELDKVRLDQRNEELENPPLGRGRGRCGGGRGHGFGRWGPGGGSSTGEQAAQRLIEEIDEISRNVEKLRVEADAEYARELVAEEERKAAGW